MNQKVNGVANNYSIRDKLFRSTTRAVLFFIFIINATNKYFRRSEKNLSINLEIQTNYDNM